MARQAGRCETRQVAFLLFFVLANILAKRIEICRMLVVREALCACFWWCRRCRLANANTMTLFQSSSTGPGSAVVKVSASDPMAGVGSLSVGTEDRSGIFVFLLEGATRFAKERRISGGGACLWLTVVVRD